MDNAKTNAVDLWYADICARRYVLPNTLLVRSANKNAVNSGVVHICAKSNAISTIAITMSANRTW